MRTIQEWIDAADDDMRAWTVFCNTHCAWSVSDLTPVVAALEIDSKPFFGPVKRADGVFQLGCWLPLCDVSAAKGNGCMQFVRGGHKVLDSGAPGGVGDKRNPPLYMKAGDKVEVTIGAVGTLTNRIIDEQ